jgi:hypothetical protein
MRGDAAGVISPDNMMHLPLVKSQAIERKGIFVVVKGIHCCAWHSLHDG